jgi:hypothetical protein
MVANDHTGYEIVDDLLSAVEWILHEEGTAE